MIVGGNAAGECKLKPLLVYRSENPRALKNKSKAGLPVIWKSNPKAWVTASQVERYCQSKQILLINNAPGHPLANLTNFDPRVKDAFLPPNTTNVFKPIDQGGHQNI